MADTRINALTTSTVSVTDDFLPIDGATAGTKKLSAYSPSFGGNATVGGTLTVNGANSTLSASSGYAISKIYGPVGGYTDFYAANGTTRNGSVGCEAAGEMYLGTRVNQPVYTLINGSVVATQTSGTLTLAPTTASTSTSSGALVVGNGTSGGLGVGGDANIGGVLRCTNGTIVASGGTPPSTGYGVEIQSNGTNGYVYSYNRNTTSAMPLYLNHTGGNLFLGNITSVANIVGTTASTSTSSGALVVSGGVGVAGSQYLGVKLNISTHDSSAGGIGFGTETNLYRYQAGGLALDHASGTAPALLFRETGTSTLRLETNSGVGYLSTLTSANLIFRTNSTTALTLDTSQNAIFAGTVRTAAPSGGTAASWKLGTVASVSPTSPNRTIEVDIGGTIYYIHAKTTNN